MLVFSGYTDSSDLEFTLTPTMAPTARLLVYQIVAGSEVVADYLPFGVEAQYTHQVQAAFDKQQAEPGQQVTVNVQTQGPAKVGLAVVDRSVFILAENRLNLAQVFAALEKLYAQPQVELHSAYAVGGGGGVVGVEGDVAPVAPIGGRQIAPGGVAVMQPNNYGDINTLSAKEIFDSTGLIVLSNKTLPQGKAYNRPMEDLANGAAGALPPQAAKAAAAMTTTAAAATTTAAAGASNAAPGNNLASVQRVRQFFPETWVWTDLTTDASGKASQQLTVPDSITTWMLNAVAISPTAGLGSAEAQLTVLQPFFIQLDLVYSAIRGEHFPVKVSLYNYGAKSEDFKVDLEQADWFDLADQSSKSVTVNSNDINGVSFNIKPKGLGTHQLKVTARSQTRADAIVKDFLVEPEGVQREQTDNLVLEAGKTYSVDMNTPQAIIDGSARALVALTGSYMAQTIEGLDHLLQMPYGCGEQNMILFAPDVAVAQYLKDTNQTKPEVMAKAESLMMTGYQRELTYRRNGQ